jgi:O-antigen ligase
MTTAGCSKALALVALAGPLLLAFNLPPSPTILNQCLSVGLTGAWIAWQSNDRQHRADKADMAAWLAALGLVAIGVAWAIVSGLPVSLAAGVLFIVGACAVCAIGGGVVAAHSRNQPRNFDLLWALLIAGVLSAAIGCTQVFAPELPDGDFVARSSIAGRAVGNLRQPNHLSSLLLWALIAVAGLFDLRRLARGASLVVAALLIFALVLTGSRTGALGVLLLALWGLIDWRLSRSSRAALIASPLVFVSIGVALSAWAKATDHVFGAEDRLSFAGSGDISSSRFAIWSNTLEMIHREPWTGVGFGEFNVAWTLSEFPDRPIAFFDHTHNLPLQLLVELGVPLGSLVMVLLLVALVQAGRRAWACEGDEGVAKRAAFMIVLMIGLHSLLEYPLWYAYFLLPTAFAWGYALARPNAATAVAAPKPARMHWAMGCAGLAMTIGSIAALLDYHQVTVIYAPPDNAAPLEDRIARGQRSPLFGHHADYAAATAFGEPKAPLSASQQLAFRRAPHQLLDVRLMIAWSQALAAEGDLDKARWLAARIREFRNPGADEYFEPCNDPVEAARAFQCQPPQRVVSWREFVQR